MSVTFYLVEEPHLLGFFSIHIEDTKLGNRISALFHIDNRKRLFTEMPYGVKYFRDDIKLYKFSRGKDLKDYLEKLILIKEFKQ